MAANLGTLTLDLVAKIGGFTGPLDKASRHSKKTSADIAKAGKAMGVALGAGAVAAAAGIALVVNSQRELIDQQAKTAQQLDTTYNSISNLKRAGELGGVGLQKIEAASRQLNLNLGKAIQGTDLQVAAFDRLGLSAQEVYDLPLDKRIATINQALRDNVQASERAAVAADIFGAKNGKAIQQLDPATIAEAARQVEIFGLNLSDVDAAKVEMANDALSTFGLLGDGIAKQLTVELAPILKALGDEFLRSADEAGGLGTVVQDTARKAVNALAFVADAGDGVGRVFSTVANTLVGMYAVAVADVNALSAAVARGLSNLPDFAGGAGFAEQAKEYGQVAAENYAIAEQALQKLRDNLERPLAGKALLQAYNDAQVAAEEAAKAAIEGRNAVAQSGADFIATEDKKTKAAKKTVDAVASQISALERAAATWGMSADEVAIYTLEVDKATPAQLKYAKALLTTVAGFEAAKKVQEDYKGLVAGLRTEEEKRSDTLREQLKILDAMQGLSGTERGKVAGRIAGQATEEAPSFGGVDAAVGGPLGELIKIDDAEAELKDWYSTQLGMLDQFRAERADLSATWDEQELALKQEHEAALAGIESARQQVQLAAGEEFFGNMSDAAKLFFGEQSSLYKAAFATEKAFAVAKVLINAPSSFSKAFDAVVGIPYVGPVLAPIAGAAAVAAQMAQVGAINGVSLGGMAHDGIDSVPQTGTWLLEKGERVTTAETSAKLDQTLSDIQRSGNRPVSNSQAVNITFNQSGMTDSKQIRESNAAAARKIAQVVQSSSRYS